MNLETYCPEIQKCTYQDITYWGLSEQRRQDLIAAALIRRIKERGDDRKFVVFLQQRGYATIRPPFIAAGKERYLIDFDLTTPETLIGEAEEWVGSRHDE